MKFKTLTGRFKEVPIHQYMIDWEGDFASKLEEDVADWIYPHWKRDVVTAQFPLPRRMSLDFLNVSKRIAIEAQGRQHSHYTPFLSGSRSGYVGQIKRDLSKQKWCELNDIILIEIFPKDIPNLSVEWFRDTWDITL